MNFLMSIEIIIAAQGGFKLQVKRVWCEGARWEMKGNDETVP